ncbi:Alpha-1,3/1,6-mannosyltransferase ALG2 [Armadillidium vulgare]|nr:Alpha-1,3/1,6-mannosyltransferase ALG2 [Armadillidium vulgare]
MRFYAKEITSLWTITPTLSSRKEAFLIKMVRVLFVHPDLGIGGAERLVIDAALALKKKGHEVSFITAHHDPNHCFPETVDGSLDVVCVGDWLPSFILQTLDYEVIFVDQISICIPVLRFKKTAKILFYCHYPDQLLTDRKSVMKKFYRFFLDKMEEITTRNADVILVNSKFTAGVFKNTFKSITISPSILHPSLDFTKFDNTKYERKKNVSLAIEAFYSLLKNLQTLHEVNLKLIIAGGYDPRVCENIEYFSELVSLAENLGIKEKIEFLKSPSDEAKISLILKSTCLIYTPSNEHFGIVPIESMYLGTPVLAVNSGGPTETVLDGITGFLKRPKRRRLCRSVKRIC